MSQNDMTIANADGATVRADINSALQALTSLSSGASEPSTTFAYQLWMDITNGILKQRNSANNAWVNLFKFNGVTGLQFNWRKGADIASATALTLGVDGNYFDVTGTTTITSIATTGQIGTVIKLHFDGALTLTHHATDLILPKGANITTAAGDEAELIEYASGDWRLTKYTRASGIIVADLNSQSATNGQILTANGSGDATFQDPAGGGGSDSGGMATDRYYVGYGRKPATASTIFADQDYAHFIEITETTIVNRAGVNITVAGAGNARFSIYNIEGGIPTSLVQDLGVVSVNTTGLVEISFTQELTPGWYALVLNSSVNFTASITQIDTNTVNPHVIGMPNYNGSYIQQMVTSRTHAAAADPYPTPVTYTDNNGPYTWLRKV